VPKIIFTHSYTQRAAKFVKKHPELVSQYQKTLELLEVNPFHPSLRLHRLRGKLMGIFSVSINISYRITIDFIIKEDIIVPIDIGTHDEVY
jgi:proteic killer suppression protein